MTFARKNALGWGFGDKVSHGDLTDIDIDVARAVDGYAGGTYTPSSAVSISKLRADLSGASTIPSGASLTAASGSTVTHSSGATETFANNPAFSGSPTLSGTLTLTSAGTIATRVVTLHASTSPQYVSSSASDIVHLPAMSGDVDLYLVAGTSVAGHVMLITGWSNRASGKQVALSNWDGASATALGIILKDGTGGTFEWAQLYFTGSVWTPIAWG